MISNGKFGVVSEKKISLRSHYRKQVATFAVAAMFGVLTLDAGVSNAASFDLGDDTRLDIDTSLTYSAAWRTDDPDSKAPSIGNSNFDKGDMVNNRFSALIDIDLQYKDYGVFLRPRAYYDERYNDSKFFEKTQDLHRDKAEILDAFVYGVFDVADRPVSLRIGQQVASWGESLFILNGISAAMSPIDATASNVPGVELKDLFLPVGQIFTEVSVTDTLTFSGFYQWDWEKSRLDETGAFFSTGDLVDDAPREFLGALRADDDDPDDQGQWGAAARYVSEALNDTEFGLYYINYHEKLPIYADINDFAIYKATEGAAGGPYHLTYDEDIMLLGASVSGIIGDTNVAGEVSYREGFSVPVESPIFLAYEKADIFQAQVSFISIMPQTNFYSNMQLTAEVGVNTVVGGLNGKQLVNDDTAWGGTFKASIDYYQIMPLLDLNIPITYQFNPDGKSSVQGTFFEDNDSIGVGLEFTYDAVYKMGLGYSHFLQDDENPSKASRDFVSLNLKYTF
jgi:hypothetical protein